MPSAQWIPVNYSGHSRGLHMRADRSSPEKVVASYVKAMFAIDQAYHEKGDKELVPSWDERGAEVNREHCTSPHRPGSIGWPSSHDVQITSVKPIDADRFEVETRREEKETYLSVHHRYAVEHRADGWRISAEYSIDNDGKTYEFWRDIDPRLLHFYDDQVGVFFDKQDRLAEVIGNNDWTYKTETGTLSFGKQFAWHAQILGSESEEKYTWRWSWANELSRLPAESTVLAQRLKQYGEKNKLVDLTTPSFPLGGRVGGWFLMTIATGLLKVPAAYCAPQDGNLTAFLLIDDPKFPTLQVNEIDPIERIVRVFKQAADSAIDPPRAFKAYLKHYGMQFETHGTTIHALQDGKVVIEAKFEYRNWLTEITACNGASSGTSQIATKDETESMTAIVRRISTALIEATPESWTDATLRVEVKKVGEQTSIGHAIHSEQHPKDVVVATDKIFTATRQLQLFSEKAGEPWSAFVMMLRQENGDWKINFKFEYAN